MTSYISWFKSRPHLDCNVWSSWESNKLGGQNQEVNNTCIIKHLSVMEVTWLNSVGILMLGCCANIWLYKLNIKSSKLSSDGQNHLIKEKMFCLLIGPSFSFTTYWKQALNNTCRNIELASFLKCFGSWHLMSSYQLSGHLMVGCPSRDQQAWQTYDLEAR